MEAVAGKAEERKPFYASMSTILAINITGKDLKDRKVTNEIDKQVEKKVKEVVDKLKISHEKFTDPDFGPNEKDEFGANSLYGKFVYTINFVLLCNSNTCYRSCTSYPCWRVQVPISRYASLG